MSTELLVATIAFLLSLIACSMCIAFAIRLKKLSRGKGAASLEDIIVSLDKDIKTVSFDHNKTADKVLELQKKMQGSIRKTALVKFNALPDLGGNQSFAMVFLDEQKNGYIMTHLAVRDRIQLFAKKVIKGTCDADLIEEEETALTNALSDKE